jgi:hypothetical protein
MAIEKSTSQAVTYEAIGIKEDYSPIITNIDPEQNMFLATFGTAKDAEAMQFNWLTEGLKPPQENAYLEMTDFVTEKVGSIERRNNTVQHFINTGRVSDAQRKTTKVYTQNDEFLRQKEIAFKQHARDIEYALVSSEVSRLESGTNPALTGGVPFFMQEEVIPVTFNAATGTVTTAVKHELETGDFVYFKTDGQSGSALPTGINANMAYYIQKQNDTEFTLYDSLEEAIKSLNQVTLSNSGTGTLQLVKNNVVDAGNTLYTDDMLNDIMEMTYKRGGNPTVAVMSGRNKRRFSAVITANAAKQRNQSTKKAINVTDVYESDFGTITAKAHRMYGDKRIDILDMAYWDLKWFVRTHEVKNLPKKGSYSEFVIEAWIGLQGTQPKASGSVINIKRS